MPRFGISGLTMELFINQSNFLQTTDHAGVKVIVHHHNATIIASNDGFTVPAGYLVSLSTKQVSFRR